MHDNQPDLALSRTFKLVDGVLSAADQAEQWAQALALRGGAQLPFLSGGEIIDSKYRVLALIGQGGMGSVYRVQHLLLGKEVALKTFSVATTVTSDAWQRFQREAQAIAKLTHINIVQVFDFGIGQGNLPYYTMELLSGQSLADKLKSRGRLSLEEALPLFVAAAGALSHAHKLGIVHRDIKPANMFLEQSKSGKEIIKIVDFGIAKLATSQNIGDQSETDTDTGFIFGSPLYMSPEQSTGAPTDQRTDIYSYGCSFFQALTGQPPFLGNNAFETIAMHHDKVPPQLVDIVRDTDFSQVIEILIAKLMAKDPATRYQSFEEVLLDLAKVDGKDHAATVRRASASLSRDKNRLLLDNTQSIDQENTQRNTDDSSNENAQDKIQGMTGRLFTPYKKLTLLGSGVIALVVLALAVVYFSHVTNKQSQIEPESSVMAKIPVDTATRTYYSTLTADGRRSFCFPDDTTMGYFLSDSFSPIRARGTVQLPPGQRIEFIPDEPFAKNPELFARFRPDDILRLNLSPMSYQTWSDQHLDCITRYLTGLTALELSATEIDGASIVQLNRLKQLTALDVSETKLTGRDLLGLERLPDLNSLGVNDIKDMHLVVEKLKGSRKLEALKARASGLTDADMPTVGTMPRLQSLFLTDNRISIVGLRHLTRLPLLFQLEMGGVKFGPECIGYMAVFKRMECLQFDMAGWSEADKKRLKEAMPPGCKIEQEPADLGVYVRPEDKN
jgi:serine/threonine-protein kinase